VQLEVVAHHVAAVVDELGGQRQVVGVARVDVVVVGELRIAEGHAPGAQALHEVDVGQVELDLAGEHDERGVLEVAVVLGEGLQRRKRLWLQAGDELHDVRLDVVQRRGSEADLAFADGVLAEALERRPDLRAEVGLAVVEVHSDAVAAERQLVAHIRQTLGNRVRIGDQCGECLPCDVVAQVRP
jgi:hypothetical protein